MAAEVIKKNIITWLFVMFVLVALAVVAVVAKVCIIQSDSSWTEKISSIQEVDIQPFRGDICAHDGRIMSTSMPTYSVHWDLSVKDLTDSIFYKNVDSLAGCMARLFGDTTREMYANRFKEAFVKKSKYFKVRDKVTLTQLTAMRKFPIFKRGRYKSGFISEQKYIRDHPHKSLALRTIGAYQYKDDKATTGLELTYNDILSGTKGTQLMRKLPSGEMYPVNAYSDFSETEPVDGQDIITTLDVNLQDVVEKNLRKQLVKYSAEFGLVVVMEVSTGKIRAMSNLMKAKDSDGYYEAYNYAVGAAYEPGSTFKLPAVMACMEKSGIDVTDSINVGDGTFKLHDITITDDHKFRGNISLRQAFEQSSNVGISKLVCKTFEGSQEEFVSRLYKMGLNDMCGIDIKGEVKPYIKYPTQKEWSGVTMGQMAYGYELQITPLQLLTFYNAVANDGVMVRPHLVEAIRSHGEIVREFKTEVLNSSICSKETLHKVRELLKGVVDNGTASGIKSQFYGIAGKTGTAQIAHGSGGYIGESGKKYTASFVGYFPTEKPKYSCIVLISKPTVGSYYASSVACPVFKAISDKLYSQDRELHLGRNFNLMQMATINNNVPVIKTGDRVILDRLCSTFNLMLTNVENAQTPYVKPSAQDGTVKIEPVASTKHEVPNVKGMGLRDAMYLLRNRGLKVTVNGRGTVKKQSIEPSTTIKKGMTIVLELG